MDWTVPNSAGVCAGPDPVYFNDFRVFFLEDFGQNIGSTGYSRITRIIGFLENDAVELVAVSVERIIVQLVINPEEDENEATHPHGQPGYIDEGIAFVSLDVPKSGLDVIFIHDFQSVSSQVSCHIGIRERKLKRVRKNEVSMSEIGYKMFISEQTHKFVNPHSVPLFQYR
jgi:hypothetical protein